MHACSRHVCPVASLAPSLHSYVHSCTGADVQVQVRFPAVLACIRNSSETVTGSRQKTSTRLDFHSALARDSHERCKKKRKTASREQRTPQPASNAVPSCCLVPCRISCTSACLVWILCPFECPLRSGAGWCTSSTPTPRRRPPTGMCCLRCMVCALCIIPFMPRPQLTSLKTCALSPFHRLPDFV